MVGRARRPARSRRPLRDRRRRRVVADAQGAVARPGRRTSANGTHSASTSPRAGPRSPRPVGARSSPTCCPATPGRSRWAGDTVNVGFGVLRRPGQPTKAHGRAVAQRLGTTVDARRCSETTSPPSRPTRRGPSPPASGGAPRGRRWPGALRRRRRPRHRPDDRRGHRPSARDRRARHRAVLAQRHRARCRAAAATSAACDAASPSTTASPSWLSTCAGAPQGRTSRGPHRRRPPTGPAATSPAGSSRTTPEPSSPPLAAGETSRPHRPTPTLSASQAGGERVPVRQIALSRQVLPVSTSMSWGRPSTRSAMMLRCTSPVPPPMVSAGANR